VWFLSHTVCHGGHLAYLDVEASVCSSSRGAVVGAANCFLVYLFVSPYFSAVLSLFCGSQCSPFLVLLYVDSVCYPEYYLWGPMEKAVSTPLFIPFLAQHCDLWPYQSNYCHFEHIDTFSVCSFPVSNLSVCFFIRKIVIEFSAS
jgi:hypothetical protein